jgi:acyl dehydratase
MGVQLMLAVATVAELRAHVGQELGTSSWRSLSQEDLDSFSQVSGDLHWVHTDPERARREAPFGGTIAQGFLTLSLLTALSGECYAIAAVSRWINYGLDSVRFLHPVVPGDRLRLRTVLSELTTMDKGGTRITLRCTLEIEGRQRPALAANWTVIAYD